MLPGLAFSSVQEEIYVSHANDHAPAAVFHDLEAEQFRIEPATCKKVIHVHR